MATTHERSAHLAGHDVAARYTIEVGNASLTVRATAIWPITEVLDHAEAVDALLLVGDEPAALEQGFIDADLHDSRMIVPPRTRRRRQRPLSSRALFYAGGVE